ncbi:MAG: hypothetical protein IB618_01110 [Candidatus Pacearchaeota archaeon]|nr:MAG: hypothetical protein IB618_01110 [Candidatus Pacearchaeota archaeon]
MSENNRFKKEIEDVYELMDTAKRYPKEDSIFFGTDPVFNAIYFCGKAKDIIENSSCKEKHDNPSPVLAKHFGINVESSEELEKEYGYKNNREMIKHLGLHSLYEYILRFDENGGLKNKARLILDMKNEKNDITLRELVKDCLGFDDSDLVKYAENQLKQNGKQVVNLVEKMYGLRQIEKYKIGLLRNYYSALEYLKELGKKLDPEGRKRFRIKNKEISDDFFDNIALDYALHGLDFRIKGLQNDDLRKRIKFFSNPGIGDYDLLEDFIEQKGENSIKKYNCSNDLFVDPKTKLEIDGKIIEKEEDKFADFITGIHKKRFKKTFEAVRNENETDFKQYSEKLTDVALKYSEILGKDYLKEKQEEAKEIIDEKKEWISEQIEKDKKKIK